jgi:hypothetical protein
LHQSHDEAIGDEASEADVIVDLVQGIESLTKDDALARVLELEENQEKTFFEIGGILSTIKKHKWFDPHASLDEWVKNNTAIKRSKARALIQIYDAIVKSGVTWTKAKHLEWTKLNAIAGVLDGSNADHWIEIASNHSRAEIKKLVQEHLVGPVVQKPASLTDMQVKTFTLRHDQVETIQVAIERAKELNHETDEAAALEAVCRDYMNHVAVTSELLAITVGDHFNTLDSKGREEFVDAMNARIASTVES